MIRTDGVTLSFGDVTVLEDVNLSVQRGELVGLVGPNGAGKTTLLRTINGILTPDSGAVYLDDERVSDLSSKAVSRRVATVPQDTSVGFAFTAEQIVEMGRTPHRSRLDWADDDEPVAAAMEQTETTHLCGRRVDDLSGGERQRVLLARALAQDTPVLVLDEPTASLDINHQVRVLETVRGLIDENRAALAAIHDLDLAARYCDRLLLLSDGSIQAAGLPETVLGDDTVEAAFGTQTAVSYNPATGTPTVAAVTDREPRGKQVHVVGSGPETARIVGSLWRAGYEVTLGIVARGDVAAETARRLDTECTTAPPLQSPGATARREASASIERADVVVTVDDSASQTLASAIEAHDEVLDVEQAESVQPETVRNSVESICSPRATGDD